MDIRIGVQHAPRELTIETDLSAEQIEAEVSRAMADGSLLRLQDNKGGVAYVSGSAIGYVEIGAPRKGGVGFGAF